MHLVWFRKDLRILDNPALFTAIQRGGSVVAAYVATPQQWQKHNMAPIQADLIFRHLEALRCELEQLNIPFLYAEKPDYNHSVQAIVELARVLGCKTISVNREYELNEQRRDDELVAKSAPLGISACLYHDRCLLPPGSILNQEQRYFKVFTPFKRKWLTQFALTAQDVCKPSCAVPHSILSFPAANRVGFTVFDSNSHFGYSRQNSSDYFTDTSDILHRLRYYSMHSLADYAVLRDFPAVDGTSRLSPYLTIGALSVRQCVAAMRERAVNDLDCGAESWLNEFIWREFYQHLVALEPKISQRKSFHSWGDLIPWRNNTVWFNKWQRGETGYPIIDAAMRQLNRTGWMHNRLRMVVASFLTKDLHIDWRWGETYFMRKLVDGDFAANNGGWQWSASTGCDAQPYFRIFNPVSQGEKFDSDGQFVRRWIPELARVPDRYLHKPWLWKGYDSLHYPFPLVDHKQQRTITLMLYQNAKQRQAG
ncbi:deoxyribodipyrimidine photo-lyase [Vibrio sp. HA2012]|uniref:deoxyribodipyrimidine photo-lyase n=1 Tax=Vibrio sp. HA2012 TaxID=1971595 RepID=UPI000C2CD723|nr:deoxyribodipyrimidine photo-lyase [Vibrio sp. HA2012]PJC86959.1 deoxyribodipyrimidine photo-lyase [Vibrio sp. HA2012]